MTSTNEVLNHHLKCFGEGDLEGVLADYTEESVVMTPQGTLKGLAAITPMFVGMFAEFGKPGASFNMQKVLVEGDYAYILWSAETADNVYEMASDTFVVKGGNIVAQTFAAKITPKG